MRFCIDGKVTDVGATGAAAGEVVGAGAIGFLRPTPLGGGLALSARPAALGALRDDERGGGDQQQVRFYQRRLSRCVRARTTRGAGGGRP